MTSLKTVALQLHAMGANVLAISKQGKKPIHTWEHLHQRRQTLAEVNALQWPQAGGIGVVNGPGGWHTFELDATKDAEGNPLHPISEATLHTLLTALSLPLDYPWAWRSGSGTGWEVAFLCEEAMLSGALPAAKNESGVFWGYPVDGADFHHAELRWEHNQTIYPPSSYTFGKGKRKGQPGPGYQWHGTTPADPPARLNVRRVIHAFLTMCPPPPHTLGSIDDTTKSAIKSRFDMTAYAQTQFGGELQKEGDEVRLTGHGGLLINPGKQVWHIFESEIGGDCFDLVAFAQFGTTVKNLNGKTPQVLQAAADYVGVMVPPRDASPAPARQEEPANHESDAPIRKLLHASDLQTLPKSEWLIEGVLPTNKLAELFGAPGQGKSFTNLDIALTVAQFANVVYIAAEDAEDYQARIAAWTQHHQHGMGGLHFWPEAINLFNQASLDAFLAEVQPLRPALIVIDPLANCMVGGDESSTKDMSIAVDALNFLRRQTQAAILICHHTGWNDAHERGSSVLRGACRVVMKLANNDGLMTLTCEKINGGKAFEPRHFQLVPVGDSVVPLPTSKIISNDSALTQKQIDILEALNLEVFAGGAAFSQLVDHLNTAKSSLNYSLSKLIKHGHVDKIGRGNAVRYKLSEWGADTLADAHSSAVQSRSVSFGGSSDHTEQGLNWQVRTEAIRSVAVQSPEALESPSSVSFSISSVPVQSDEFSSVQSSPPIGAERLNTELNDPTAAEPIPSTDEYQRNPREALIPYVHRLIRAKQYARALGVMEEHWTLADWTYEYQGCCEALGIQKETP